MYEFSTLWWSLNTVSGHLMKNAHTLVNYGALHRKGLPISSSIAESAVNQVVTLNAAVSVAYICVVLSSE
ncbi:hypothetical protein GNZ12_28720 [Paraburkholderia sp. 1N]|uniref:Uncharacterized protein n=1 Tax=Paraburkholderia solitsugae TaxID=2675748 RepID=A0ABX2BYI5_9BURK|nr:hypothetical protein [Paraburkholderia solitsugae]NPT45236.1 hypothetical protein [Paraburkholderia solitsugae]